MDEKKVYSQSLAFTDGRLEWIENPLDPFLVNDNFGEAEEAYGFRSGWLKLDREEPDDCRLTIRGPAFSGRPYEFYVEIEISSTPYQIWCKDLIGLHEYLIYAAPLLGVLQRVGEREDREYQRKWGGKKANR